MKRARPFSQKSRRWLSLTLTLSLIISCLVLVPFDVAFGKRPIPSSKRQAGQNNGQERRATPPTALTGSPAANLPNLDQLRSAAQATRNARIPVQAPPPMPSSRRGFRKQGGIPKLSGSSVPLPPIGSRNLIDRQQLATAKLAASVARRRFVRSHHAIANRKAANANANAGPSFFPQVGRVNYAASAAGAIATASSSYPGLAPSGAQDGNRSGSNYGSNTSWGGATATFPHWLQIDFNGSKTIDEIDLFTLQDNYQNPSAPTETMTFSLYGLTGFEVQFWDGANWVTIPGGSVTGNNKVWRQFSFSAITTTRIRVLTSASVSQWSELTELEAWGNGISSPTNVALSANGATATASSSYPGMAPSGAQDGNRSGSNYGSNTTWAGATATFPQWLQIDFNSSRTIDEIDLFTLQDNYENPSAPTETMTFTSYGLTGFEVQFWDGANWVTIPGGSVTGNNKVWRKFVFPAVTTSRIKVITTASNSHWSEITELEAWTATTGSISPSDFAMARLDPRNRTGTGGEDLLSNNLNWSLPLVSLPGRGLDLGLTLSYNSLVWIRAGNFMDFDVDQGSIAPGFRLGFPIIEGPYWNNQANANFYLLVTPSGARVELRQNGSGSILYESKDSSYLQLTDNLDGTMTLRPTDGSQLRYVSVAGGWRSNQIKDRNGNYLSVIYKSWGEIETVTDTLGRVLTFNYDANWNIQSINQTWAGQQQPHEWTTFGWGTATIGNNLFPNLNNLGPSNTMIPVLAQVGLPDGSRYSFEYNSYGQVRIIHNFANDPNNSNHERNSVTYVYSTGDGTDCPRINERQDHVEYWTGVNGVPDPVVTSLTHDTDGGCRLTMPDGTVFKDFYGSGWQGGLGIETRNYASVADANSNIWQKKTTTAYTQDNTSVSYLTNPRATETNIYDSSSNRRRTTMSYTSYSLPSDVYEYAADATSVLRRTHTDYNSSSTYTELRIIGLPSAQYLCDSAQSATPCGEASGSSLLSKVTYQYDEAGSVQYQGSPAQHESVFDSTTVLGRANLSSVRRYDVTNLAQYTASSAIYNTAGSIISNTDAANHTSTIGYSDSFSVDGTTVSNPSVNTMAYPTTLTDADGFQSTVRYRYDFGARTRLQGPPPQNQPNGAIQTFAYDSAGRISQVTTQNNGAYVRYVYGPNYVLTYATVNNVADDSYSVQHFDGLGRVYAAASLHPGSAGGYKAQLAYYDVMGRAFQQSNPTEIRSDWLPWGDDVYNAQTDTGGWRFTQQTYDWKGRPLRTTNTDGTYKDASYAGCGCAGGEVVTLTDEVGRRQKVYSDVLGRQWKSEVLNWDGSVYATTTNSLNARDQATVIRQYAGTDQSTTYQDTTIAFDGYGRLVSRHDPEQSSGAFTTFSYNPDDTLLASTDGRSARTTYNYNGRHLLTGINYSAPYGILTPGNVTVNYDPAGNRTSMNDGLGTTTYQYDQLSRLTSESRYINGLPNAPVPNNTYTISYAYNLAGLLMSLTDAFGEQVVYDRDSSGRISTITRPAGYNGIPDTMSGIQYRAWGKAKQVTFGWNGNSATLSYTHDTRMEPSRFQVTSNMSGTFGAQYQRNADGMVSYAQDLSDSQFDRAYTYDQEMGRVTLGLTGAEARGSGPADGPYKQTYGYDAFSNLTNRTGRHWTRNAGTQSSTFVNNRNTQWQYDADGRVTQAGTQAFRYDAAGREINPSGAPIEMYDGNGLRQRDEFNRYEIRSSVLGGQVVDNVLPNGQKDNSVIYADNNRVGTAYGNGSNLNWEIHSPINSDELVVSMGSVVARADEFSPIGDNVGTENPYINWGGADGSFGYPAVGGDASNMRCAFDGNEIDCNSLNKFYISKNWVNVLTLTIRSQLGTRVPQQRADLVPGGSHGGKIVPGTVGPGGQPSQVEIIGEPDRFEITSTPGAMQWLHFKDVNYLVQIPQNPDKAIAAAVDRARTILSTKNSCSDYFGTNATKALNTFEKILTRGYPNGPGDTQLGIKQSGQQTTHNQPTEYRTFQNAVINNAGPFFNLLSKTRFGGYNPGSNQSQVLQILHELAHLVYSGGAPLIPDDSGATKKVDSDTNTREILKHCRDQIDKIKN